MRVYALCSGISVQMFRVNTMFSREQVISLGFWKLSLENMEARSHNSYC